MKKRIALILAVVLLLGIAVGATIAWLTDTTEEVKNTFIHSTLDVTLEETTGDEYKMIPGHYVEKDPKAGVPAGSEDAYLFVEVTEADGVVTYTDADGVSQTTKWSDFLTYEIADGWTLVPGESNVYYRTVMADAAEADRAFYVLKDNKVYVKNTVTKEMMDALDKDTTKYPTLTFQAYAVQYWENNTTHFEPAEAWANITG